MQQALRPYATAGVAIVGAGLVAIAPVVTPLPDAHAVRDVTLASTFTDFMTPWIDQYNEAAANATVLANNFFLAPFVGAQQFVANQSDFWGQIFADPSSIPDVAGQMEDNWRAYTQGYTLFENGGLSGLGPAGDPITDLVTDRTRSGEAELDLTGNTISVLGHKLLLALLPGFLPAELDPDAVEPIINFLASPLSGIIMGSIGPWVSPWVALGNSISDGDGLNEIFANMVGAYYNGATLNLDALAPLINSLGLLPEGSEIHSIDLAFGGLLTPGVVASADNLVPGTTDMVAAPGGSIFNSLGLNLDVNFLGLALPADIPAHAIGPIGAWEAWSQTVGALLGSGWSGKANPQDAIAPLTGFSFPQIPADFLDDGGAAGAAADAGASIDWSALLDGLGA